MKKLKLYVRAFFLIAWLSRGDGYSCPYGQNCANTFEPAPPGRAPPCAQPGLTYCVHPDPYPEQIIRRLIEAGQYDISTLLSDETRDDFNSHKKVDYGYGYGPNSLPNVDQISIVNEPKNYNTKFHSRFNHEIFSQKTPLQPPSPVDPSPYNINAFQSSNFSKFGYQNPNYWAPFDYENKINRNVYNQNFYNTPFSQYDSADWFRQAASGVTQYNPMEWWKYPSRSEVTVQRSVSFPTRSTRHRRRRNAELVRASEQRQLTGAEALRIALGLARDIRGASPSASARHRGAVSGPHRLHHAARRAQQQGELAIRRQHAQQHDAAGAR
ncbi:uncharacterized protein LOC125226662 isoform X2 [Leguminivora glycinivorella]|uniref:uncharacterized protein LOC125226662 isoform X2 n=1 Tax=Leguminivora glycinivorella TaxID=1035111 RepID=UPI00200FBE44|nr:uncharacterized protein LOC125226662 isoform X2 [Leguminivora glycinivorella]